MSATTMPAAQAPAQTPPPRASGPKPHRWTLTGYRNLAKAGLLDGLRTMLIGGEILIMPNPGTLHDTALSLTAAFLQSICPTGHYVRNQQSFNVGTANDPGPDLAVVPGAIRDYVNQAPTTAALIVEVADTSLAIDTTTKAELYATAGVAAYWVIDLNARELHVVRDPQPLPLPTELATTAYQTRFTLGPNDSVSPQAAPNASVRVADLLP